MDSSAFEADIRKARENWWLYLVLGIVMAILGMVALSAPFITAIGVAAVLGLVLVIGGILHAVHAFAFDGPRNVVLGLIVAMLYILAGFILIRNPLSGVVALTILLAIFFLAEGIVKIAQSAQAQYRVLGSWGWLLFSGILSLILGMLIATGWPASALWAIGLLLGIDLIVTGFSMVALSVTIHGAHIVPTQPAVPQQ